MAPIHNAKPITKPYHWLVKMENHYQTKELDWANPDFNYTGWIGSIGSVSRNLGFLCSNPNLLIFNLQRVNLMFHVRWRGE